MKQNQNGSISTGGIVVIAIVFLVIGAIGSYAYVNQINNEKFENMESDIDNHLEFERLLLKAEDKINEAYLNQGLAETYDDEGGSSYESELYDQGVIYFSYAYDYYSYTNDGLQKGLSILNQAKIYATNDNQVNAIDKYILLLNKDKDLNSKNIDLVNAMGLACYYYNISEWDQGDEKIDDHNELLEDFNDLVDEQNDLLYDYRATLDISWKA